MNVIDTAEANIHLRARSADRDLIDQAAALTGANRSQFMLASSIEKAKSVLLDQTTLLADAASFQAILATLDASATAEQEAGMQRLARAGRHSR
jgi:uncharacterized protein (DUF1778 family)